MSGLPLDQILIGDCRARLAELPEASVDLVFADPPYNLQLSGRLLRPDNSRVDGVDHDWDRFGDGGEDPAVSFAAYDAFSEDWLRAVRRVLKPTGSLWLIGSYHNIYRLGRLVQDIGFWLLNDIVWVKTNPMPNFRGTRFANAHETLLWCSMGPKARYTFNYAQTKEANDGTQMRSDWEMPICIGPERLKEGRKKVHPTQKPEALLYRILTACSHPGDVVLDPFFGTGTTGAVARKLGRRWIGIEQDQAYATAALKRIADVQPAPDTALAGLVNGRKLQRLPFARLLELGLIAPGDALVDRRRRYCATVCIDGRLLLEDGRSGSIHKVGALVQDAPACNGWDFWHVAGADNSLIVLDDLRKQVLQAGNQAFHTNQHEI